MTNESSGDKRPLVYALTKYGGRGASSRVRFKNLTPALEQRGWRIRHFPLLSDEVLARFYQTKSHDLGLIARCYALFFAQLVTAPRPALWWVEKELLAGLPSILEWLFMPGLERTIIDYDDAVFLKFADARLGAFGRARKFVRYARGAGRITVGSEFLRHQFAGWGGRRITKIPSTVTVGKYPLHVHRLVEVVTIGWIGTPMTVEFLETVRQVLPELARRVRLRFCVVGATWSCTGIETISIPWTEETEAAAVSTFDIGIMPLPEGDWERGKCGYKLIQYMAAGVVPVGSRVGENPFIIQDGENGYLASTPEEWLEKLEMICGDAQLRARVGAAARRKAETQYDVTCAAAAVHEVFAEVFARRARP